MPRRRKQGRERKERKGRKGREGKEKTNLKKPHERRDRLVQLQRRHVLADADARPEPERHVAALHGGPPLRVRLGALALGGPLHPALGPELVRVLAKHLLALAHAVRRDARLDPGRQLDAVGQPQAAGARRDTLEDEEADAVQAVALADDAVEVRQVLHLLQAGRERGAVGERGEFGVEGGLGGRVAREEVADRVEDMRGRLGAGEEVARGEDPDVGVCHDGRVFGLGGDEVGDQVGLRGG